MALDWKKIPEREKWTFDNGRRAVTITGAARALDVHWTRVYFLVRKRVLMAARMTKPGDKTRLWISWPSLMRYDEQRAWWNNLHGGGKRARQRRAEREAAKAAQAATQPPQIQIAQS